MSRRWAPGRTRAVTTALRLSTAVAQGHDAVPALPIGEPGTALDVPASDEADAMSKGDIFLLALAVLAAVVAVGAAIESNWLSVAVFSGLVVSNLVMLMQFRRRRRREL